MKGIIDYSILFYRFYHKMKSKIDFDLNDLDLLIENKIRGISLDTGVMDMYLAGDYGASWRKKIYSEYKGNKRTKDKESIRLYSEVLNRLKKQFDVYSFKDLEADDICYLFAKKYPGSIVISEDSDMHQVNLLPKTKLYLPFKRQYYSGTPFLSMWKKVLLGDKSDNIMRCVGAGCGPVAVNKAYLNSDHQDDFLDCLDFNFGINKKQLKLNKKLIMFSEVDYSKFKLKL